MTRKNVTDTLFLSTQDTTKEVEVFPGVMERRYFLRSSTAVAVIAALGALAPTALAQGPTTGMNLASAGKLSWEEFLRQSVPAAQQMVKDAAFSQDEYLYRLASLATRLQEVPQTKMGVFKGPLGPPIEFAPSYRGTPFVIIQWRMAPGATLPAHNHPNGSVCTLGVEGECRVRNFEIVGEAPAYSSKQTFRIRETRSDVLTPGRISTLSSTRDNIHYFQVGKEGARGIDITTLHGRNAPFSFLNIEDRSVDPEKRTFEASWLSLGG